MSTLSEQTENTQIVVDRIFTHFQNILSDPSNTIATMQWTPDLDDEDPTSSFSGLTREAKEDIAAEVQRRLNNVANIKCVVFFQRCAGFVGAKP